MAVTVTAKETLMAVLDDVRDVYFVSTVCDSASDVAAITTAIELPVIEDSIEVNMGEVDAAYTKTTDGTIAAAKFTKGDPDCGFQIVSIAETIASIFSDKVKVLSSGSMVDDSASLPAMETGDETITITGWGNGLKVTAGTLIMMSADHKHSVTFPNAQITGSFVPTGGGDANTGYWDCAFVPRPNAAGASFYLG